MSDTPETPPEDDTPETPPEDDTPEASEPVTLKVQGVTVTTTATITPSD